MIDIMSTPAIKPYSPHIDIREVERLHTKIKDVRVPTLDVVPDSGNDYGIPTQWAVKLHDYWQNKFSWSAAEGRINQFDHFMTELEGVNLHFVHQKSPVQDAIPILLIHGWPGSFYEFSEVIKPLTQAGSDSSFHCVVPSLPGFCWSSAPPRKGWTVKDTARIFDALMQRLGYDKYCVQAGDWGAMVAREIGAQYETRCRVMHLNWCPGALPEGTAPTEREAKCAAKGQNWRTNHVGYAVLMRTRPQSVGWMLEDNPVGLMTFIGEKVSRRFDGKTYDTDILVVRRGFKSSCPSYCPLDGSYPDYSQLVLPYEMYRIELAHILRESEARSVCSLLRAARESNQVSVWIH